MEGRGQTEQKRNRKIEPHRHCPLCWADGSGGYGTAYSTSPVKTYYRCDQTVDPQKAPCGFTWTVQFSVIVNPVQVSYKTVNLSERRS